MKAFNKCQAIQVSEIEECFQANTAAIYKYSTHSKMKTGSIIKLLNHIILYRFHAGIDTPLFNKGIHIYYSNSNTITHNNERHFIQGNFAYRNNLHISREIGSYAPWLTKKEMYIQYDNYPQFKTIQEHLSHNYLALAQSFINKHYNSTFMAIHQDQIYLRPIKKLNIVL